MTETLWASESTGFSGGGNGIMMMLEGKVWRREEVASNDGTKHWNS